MIYLVLGIYVSAALVAGAALGWAIYRHQTRVYRDKVRARLEYREKVMSRLGVGV